MSNRSTTDIQDREAFLDRIGAHYRAMKPMMGFLCEAIGARF